MPTSILYSQNLKDTCSASRIHHRSVRAALRSILRSPKIAPRPFARVPRSRGHSTSLKQHTRQTYLYLLDSSSRYVRRAGCREHRKERVGKKGNNAAAIPTQIYRGPMSFVSSKRFYTREARADTLLGWKPRGRWRAWQTWPRVGSLRKPTAKSIVKAIRSGELVDSSDTLVLFRAYAKSTRLGCRRASRVANETGYGGGAKTL